jgi:hypothetical protein
MYSNRQVYRYFISKAALVVFVIAKITLFLLECAQRETQCET